MDNRFDILLDSINDIYPPGRKTGVPKLFKDLGRKTRVPELVLDPKRKHGVPKIVVDLDQGPSCPDRLMALRQFKKNLNNDLVNPSSKETKKSRRKEGANEKVRSHFKFFLLISVILRDELLMMPNFLAKYIEKKMM